MDVLILFIYPVLKTSAEINDANGVDNKWWWS